MRSIPTIICSAVLAGSAMLSLAQTKLTLKPPPKSATSAAPAKTATPVSAPKSLLPDSFAGWNITDGPTTVTDPVRFDSANAAALKEFGFQSAILATYTKGTENITVRAPRFGDLSGAYGAYSYYRGSGWPREDIGTGAASNHNRVLFWRGDTMVDATFSTSVPCRVRNCANWPASCRRLLAPERWPRPSWPLCPITSLDGQSTHYAVGPASYAGSGGALPPELVGFDRGAEAVTANYSLVSGPATLTLIDYPTPQMAAAEETRIRAYIQAGGHAQPAFPKPLADSDQASLEVRRSGPIVALVSGDAIPDESHKLLASVHYESDFVSIPQPSESEVSKTGRLLLGIATLVIIGSAAAILLGLFLGGGRALYRIARGKPASSVYEAEFIRLDLPRD